MSYAKDIYLQEGWKLKLVDNARIQDEICTLSALEGYDTPMLDAKVPGDWVIDYVRSGLLDEPFFGNNYLQMGKYETYHVFYGIKFDWQEEPNAYTYLHFDGIDTVADIYLNGKKIGHAEDMYIAHEFAAAGLVKGENELLVHIRPVALEARKYHIAANTSTLPYNYEAMVIRKATHMFGWDICPRMVSAGLWRSVRMVVKKPQRIEDLFLWLKRVEKDGSALVNAVMDIDIGEEPIFPYTMTIEGTCGDSHFAHTAKMWHTHNRIEFRIPNAKLWWIRGYGDPNLYDITATLKRDGAAVDTHTFRLGLRSIRLENDEMIVGNAEGKFRFILNGKQIYIKGTNWVPADALHSRDMERIPEILKLVWDVGCNAMRIWGGGVYESDYFYDWCDEHGIFLWHDFMMACGMYPQSERMKQQLYEEAGIIVRRLRNHASICLWAGDNECDCSYASDNIDPAENELTRVILPRVLREEDISRPYLPSSPYISTAAFESENFWNATPEQHLWGPRDYYKGHYYHDHMASFASEMGYHGCNSPESIRKFIPADKLWPETNNDMWIYHAASPETEDTSIYWYRIKLMSSQITYVFKQKPQDLDTYARMSQICQAEAKKYFVESFRSHKGTRTGLIWWNIMDCWPQFSDAVVDYYFCKKLAYYFIRRSQQPLCLMMDDRGGTLKLYAVNDLLADGEVTYRVTDADTGAVIAAGTSRIAADASTELQPILHDGKQHFYCIEWTAADGTQGKNHYLQGTPLFDYDWYMACLKKMGFDEFEGFDK